LKLEKVSSDMMSESLPSLTNASQPTSKANGNETSDGNSLDMLLPHLISAQARKTPDALALASETQSLTYDQLDGWASQLACRLQSLGVGPDALVAICLQRSPELVVAALAVMKAGGAYVPMDPDFPVERLLFMLRDTQVQVLITHEQISGRLPTGNWRVLMVEREPGNSSQRGPELQPVAVTAEDLAYVVYTSGSTGRPKGVKITHRGLLNLISWHCREFSINSADRASQVANVGFDAAVWDICPYLAAGASVHFPDDETRGGAKALHDWLLEHEITVSFVPTSLAESLMFEAWPERVPLRLLLTGADTLRRFPPSTLPFRLINNYGPTECTVVATSGVVLPDQRLGGLPTIGRPIDNVQTYILDDQLQPVSGGAVGELYVAGAGLGRGYLNRPDQDAQYFVPNPFGGRPNERMYRTGDLVRYLPDGQIGFVGRIDDQVKIRGYRIEPSEIVTVLNQYPGVQASLVVARSETTGDKRLVAYLVSSDSQLVRNDLRDYLRTYLPDYMVPAMFVRLSSLPLNSSGKIDRSMLPAPSDLNTIGDQIYVAPRTAVEKQMVSILAELLGMERVGVNDNFFFLGGHSLLGTQLIARARDSFGIELPLRTVFDWPTAAELSVEIERMLRGDRMSAD
jgi:amino acid adenylation domain-containing protein